MKMAAISRLWFFVLMCTAGGLLVACGGGANSTGTANSANSADAVKNIEISGKVADGYLRNALVFFDCNNNGIQDADESATLSGAGGVYRLQVSEQEKTQCPIVVDASDTEKVIDEDDMADGKMRTLAESAREGFVLRAAPGQHEFISPLSMLFHELGDKSGEEAKAAMQEAVAVMTELTGMQEADLRKDYLARKNAKASGYAREISAYLGKIRSEAKSKCPECRDKLNKHVLDMAADDLVQLVDILKENQNAKSRKDKLKILASQKVVAQAQAMQLPAEKEFFWPGWPDTSVHFVRFSLDKETSKPVMNIFFKGSQPYTPNSPYTGGERPFLMDRLAYCDGVTVQVYKSENAEDVASLERIKSLQPVATLQKTGPFPRGCDLFLLTPRGIPHNVPVVGEYNTTYNINVLTTVTATNKAGQVEVLERLYEPLQVTTPGFKNFNLQMQNAGDSRVYLAEFPDKRASLQADGSYNIELPNFPTIFHLVAEPSAGLYLQSFENCFEVIDNQCKFGVNTKNLKVVFTEIGLPGMPVMCSNYKLFDSAGRSRHTPRVKDQKPFCDRNLQADNYRFQGSGGDMLASYPPGTEPNFADGGGVFPVFTSMPRFTEENVVKRLPILLKGIFQTYTEHYSAATRKTYSTIDAVYCNNSVEKYYVYRLEPTNACPESYITEWNVEPQPTAP